MTRYAARRLPIHRGPAAWSKILGPQPPALPLNDNRTADFVIIGGGFAGLSAARRLAQLQPGAHIVLLEAGRIAEGAAGRNSGFMIDLPHELTSKDYGGARDDQALINLNRQAIAFGRDAVADYGVDPSYFDITGKINGAASAAAHARNVSYARHLSHLGETSELLDAKQMLERTGSAHYRSGLYTPGTAMLQPAGYIRGLAAGLSTHVAIHENSAVTGFTQVGDGWEVWTATASVSAPRIILAINGHLESFGIAQGRLMQLFLFAAMTAELDADARRRLGGAARWGITPSDPMGTTMRRIDAAQGGHRIVTRTCAALRPGMVPTQADMDRAARVQRRKFDARFPQLAGTPMDYKWAGHLCLSLNGVAVMREIDRGVYSACVQNGLGTTRGTLTGMAAAELACGETSDITRHFTAEAAPKRLPPQALASIGANLVIRWKEWKAAAD